MISYFKDTVELPFDQMDMEEQCAKIHFDTNIRKTVENAIVNRLSLDIEECIVGKDLFGGGAVAPSNFLIIPLDLAKRFTDCSGFIPVDVYPRSSNINNEIGCISHSRVVTSNIITISKKFTDGKQTYPCFMFGGPVGKELTMRDVLVITIPDTTKG